MTGGVALRSAPRQDLGHVTTGYRADIDGLRAVAVACVVLFHAFPGALPGGFVGVDVFFVISGYLISRILFAGLDRGRLDLAGFYARRIRRIFPALILVLAATLGYGFVVLLPSELAALGKSVAGGAGFVDNLIFWRESGYFDSPASAKPLLHLWSLGVEEQFYLLWPLLLWLSGRARRGAVLAVALLSFAANLALIHWDPSAAFYWPVSRLWELACGGLLAAAPQLLARSVRDGASVLGLALILFAASLLGAGTMLPAVLPVAGAGLLIAAGPQAWVNRRVLSRRGAVALGQISYALYLWHWPPLAFASILRLGKPPTPLMAAAIIAGAGVAAWLTTRFVERPIRFGGPRRAVMIALAGLMALALIAGLVVLRASGFPSRFGASPTPDIAKIDAAARARIFRPTRDMRVADHGDLMVARIGRGPQIATFIGDSVVFQYGPRVQRLLEQGRLAGTATFVVGASCAPVPGVFKPGKFAGCADLPAVAAAELAMHPAPVVVIGGAWQYYVQANVTVERGGARYKGDSPAGVAAFYANLQDEVAAEIAAGRRVVLVLCPPASRRFAPEHMVARSLGGTVVSPQTASAVPVATLRAVTADADRRLRALAATTRARVLDPFGDVCGSGPACSAFYDDGTPKYSDALHLRREFVAEHVRMFDPILTSQPPRRGP